VKHYSKHGLMAGAAALAASPHARAPELKDADLGGLVSEVKTAVVDLGKTFETYKAKNDERLADLAKGKDDVLTKADLEKINKAIDEGIANVKKRMDEAEAKANRLALGGGAVADPEAKAAKVFGDMIGKADLTVEDYREYKSALDGYLRHGPNHHSVKATTLSVGTDPAGGYLVTPDTSGRMVQKVYETSPMRQLCSVVQIGTDSLEGPIDNQEADAQWIGEQQTRNQTDAPKLGMWKIPVNELYAYPTVTQKLLEDAKVDVEAWLANKASAKMGRKENTAFVAGTGELQPRGILSYSYAATADATRAWGTFEQVLTGTNASFGTGTNGGDVLLSLIFALKAAYRANAKFLMARKTMSGVRKIKDGQGNYLTALRLADNYLVETIFGFPVVDGEDMPDYSTGTPLAIAFGDFAEAYTIVDRLGIFVVRDNITQPGFVKYHMRKRTGGGALNFEALKFLKFSA
jgi:HK97 family phage major capsid protein